MKRRPGEIKEQGNCIYKMRATEIEKERFEGSYSKDGEGGIMAIYTQTRRGPPAEVYPRAAKLCSFVISFSKLIFRRATIFCQAHTTFAATTKDGERTIRGEEREQLMLISVVKSLCSIQYYNDDMKKKSMCIYIYAQ